MSKEGVELVRRAFDAFNRAFGEGAADLYELIDPEVEWIPMSALLEGTSYQGHDGVRQWMEEMKRDWTSYETRPESFLDLGDDRVLALGTWRAQGRGGDVLLDFPQAAWLVQVRRDRIAMVRTFTDRSKALQAAGLSEQAISHENVEVVRRSIEAWNRRDRAAFLALFRSDAEIDWSRSRAPFKGVYRGQTERQAFWDVFWSTFEDVHIETHGLLEAGSEVVVLNTAHMRGRDGIEVVARSALVDTVESGKITRLRLFQERAEALEAVGLRA
jgi:ketosteroid isomerase-like protein